MLFVSNNPVPSCPYNMWFTSWPGPALPQLYATPMDAFIGTEEVLSSCELPHFSPGLLSLQPQRESTRDWHPKLQHWRLLRGFTAPRWTNWLGSGAERHTASRESSRIWQIPKNLPGSHPKDLSSRTPWHRSVWGQHRAFSLSLSLLVLLDKKTDHPEPCPQHFLGISPFSALGGSVAIT